MFPLHACTLVDLWAARLADAGHEVDGPHANDRFEIYHLFVRDPDGHLVELRDRQVTKLADVEASLPAYLARVAGLIATET